MFCGKCGTKINDGDVFCTNCGARVVVNNVAGNNNSSNEKSDSSALVTKIKNVKCISEYSDETEVDEMETIEFGSYPQSDASGKSKEPIEWIVLEKSNDSAFLMAKYILDCKTYGVYNDFRTDHPCWENSILRKWLNTEFYSVAFNNSEKELIKTTKVANIPNYYNKDEKATEDKIFCLSIEEVGKYFNRKIDEYDKFSENECKKLATYGTIYAKNVDNDGNKLYEEKIGMWFDNNHPFWLRSHGNDQGDGSEICSDGKICQSTVVSCTYIGVRPAMWIKLK